MSAIITIFKSELNNNVPLIQELNAYCKEIHELKEAYVYSIKPGLLMPFLDILKKKEISYGTHFDTHDFTIKEKDRKDES